MTHPPATAGVVHGHHDPLGAKIGMWLFLLTEILLFGTLFIVFANYHRKYPIDYHQAALELNRLIGAVNTLVLLTSSLTMVLAIAALEKGRRERSVRWILATIALALTFLVIKGFEWSHKFHEGIYPQSAELYARAQGQVVFFGSYFLMTGLHALHVLVGIGLLGAVALYVRRGRVHAGRISLLENAGLYWHLVDIIWIYLFPLFYLVGR